MHLEYANGYMQALFNAMKTEQLTNTMVYQVLSTKEIINKMGEFMNEDSVNQMCKEMLHFISLSDTRKDMNLKYTTENEDGEDEIDIQNRQFMQEENDVEDELQFAISETFGILFKTHKLHCKELLVTLFGDLLPNYLQEDSPFVKQKFALFVIVDLLEHLGYENLGDQFKSCFETLLRYSKSDNAVYRQAANYGFGIAAKFCPEGFKEYKDQVLECLKYGIDYPKNESSTSEFHHARDNSLSALGKIMKFFADDINVAEIFPYWLNQMPIEHDHEEAKEMNDFLAEVLISNPKLVVGEQLSLVPKLIAMLAEQTTERTMNAETMEKFKRGFASVCQDSNMKSAIEAEYLKINTDVQKKRIDKLI